MSLVTVAVSGSLVSAGDGDDGGEEGRGRRRGPSGSFGLFVRTLYVRPPRWHNHGDPLRDRKDRSNHGVGELRRRKGPPRTPNPSDTGGATGDCPRETHLSSTTSGGTDQLSRGVVGNSDPGIRTTHTGKCLGSQSPRPENGCGDPCPSPRKSESRTSSAPRSSLLHSTWARRTQE